MYVCKFELEDVCVCECVCFRACVFESMCVGECVCLRVCVFESVCV